MRTWPAATVCALLLTAGLVLGAATDGPSLQASNTHEAHEDVQDPTISYQQADRHDGYDNETTDRSDREAGGNETQDGNETKDSNRDDDPDENRTHEHPKDRCGDRNRSTNRCHDPGECPKRSSAHRCHDRDDACPYEPTDDSSAGTQERNRTHQRCDDRYEDCRYQSARNGSDDRERDALEGNRTEQRCRDHHDCGPRTRPDGCQHWYRDCRYQTQSDDSARAEYHCEGNRTDDGDDRRNETREDPPDDGHDENETAKPRDRNRSRSNETNRHHQDESPLDRRSHHTIEGPPGEREVVRGGANEGPVSPETPALGLQPGGAG